MVTAVSRSYTTLALGILLLGYLSTELLPHRALSLGLALCGGGAFLYGALVSFAEGTRLTLAHPQYGDLIWYPHANHDTDKPQTGQEIRISVDENQIVWFD